MNFLTVLDSISGKLSALGYALIDATGLTAQRTITLSDGDMTIPTAQQLADLLNLLALHTIDPDGANNPSTTKATPMMISNVSPFGLCFASSHYGAGYEPYVAFNGVQEANTGWASTNTAYPHYIGYKFTQPKVINKFILKSRVFNVTVIAPENYEIEGSSDTTTGIDGVWTSLGSFTNSNTALGAVWTNNFVNNMAYSAYRLKISSGHYSSGNIVGIAEIELIEATFHQL